MILVSVCLLVTMHGQTTLRLASPFHSTSEEAKALRTATTELRARTGGAMELFVTYESSLPWSEPAMAEDIRQGKFDGAFLTASGLSAIDSDFNILRLPFLVTTATDMSRTQNQLGSDFTEALSRNGMALGCWANPGPEYIFTANSASDMPSLKAVKLAVFPDDAPGKAFLARAGLNPVEKGFREVRQGLSNRTVDGVIGPAATTARFEWNLKVRYMIGTPVRFAAGAVIIRKAFIDSLTQQQRQILMEVMGNLGADLDAALAGDAMTAMSNLMRLTVSEVTFSQAGLNSLEQAAEASWRELSGTLYSPAILQKVRTLLGK